MNRINSGSLFIYIKCLDIWPFRYEELYMFQFTHKIQQTVVSDSFFYSLYLSWEWYLIMRMGSTEGILDMSPLEK